MRDFRSNDRSRGRRDFGRPELHDAVCDECKKDCKVPFRPSGDKPIYCSDCFEKKGGRDGNRSRGGRDSGRSFQRNASDPNTSKLVENIEILNTKLDKIIDLLSSSKKESKTKKSKKSKNKKMAEAAE